MKFTLGWLKDHLDTQATLDDIVSTLNAVGLEVDSVEDRGAALAAFKTARVVEAAPHPNADRLTLCTVDTGEGTVQVVCGAPNARTGMVGVYAPVGSRIPGLDMTLKAATIRGVESRGMLVSEREMGLSDEHEGIIELPEGTAVGVEFARILGLDDPVIDIELTPNRPDCTGVRGIARDLAAAGRGALKPLAAMEPLAGGFASPMRWATTPESACTYVVGRYFRGVRNGPSPRWLADRLRAIGLRPISALVDMTNYVTIDLGRPLHVFDAGRLHGDTLAMRLARKGERIAALDGKTYTLDERVTVIADDEGPQGIGGVMGGEASGCTAETTEVFLEAALFDPVRIAETGRRLNIQSDARYRFERGVDATSADWGAEVAARLILSACGGEASHTVRAGTRPGPAAPIILDMGRARRLCGVDIAPARQVEILTALGFETQGDAPTASKALPITPPPWRPDIGGEADLVEEIVRIHGYERVPVVPLRHEGALPEPALAPEQRRAMVVRRALAARGLYEAITWSFMSAPVAEEFADAALCGALLRLANPISADLDVMRPSILPNLILAAARNLARGLQDPALFELGPQYRDATPSGQDLVAAGIRQGRAGPAHWAAAPRAVDAFDAKADALAALEAAGAPVANLSATRDAPAWYHPGRSGALRLGPTVLAWFGALHPRVLDTLDLRGPAVGFEVFLDRAPRPKAGKAGKAAGPKRRPLALSPFQPVRRDFAFVVAADTPAAEVIQAVRGADRTLIAEVTLFDVYTGRGIGEGEKSLALTVTLQPAKATMTEAEIDAVASRIVRNVEKRTGGRLRT